MFSFVCASLADSVTDTILVPLGPYVQLLSDKRVLLFEKPKSFVKENIRVFNVLTGILVFKVLQLSKDVDLVNEVGRLMTSLRAPESYHRKALLRVLKVYIILSTRSGREKGLEVAGDLLKHEIGKSGTKVPKVVEKGAGLASHLYNEFQEKMNTLITEFETELSEYLEENLAAVKTKWKAQEQPKDDISQMNIAQDFTEYRGQRRNDYIDDLYGLF